MNEKNKALQERYTNIDVDLFADEIIDTLFNDYTFSCIEAAQSLICLVVRCKTDEEFKLVNDTCIALLGWSLETLIENAEKRNPEDMAV